MFDALFSFLAGLLQNLWDAIKSPIEKGWAFLVLAVGWVAFCIDKAGDWVQAALSAFDNVTLPSGLSVVAPSSASHALAIANTFAPVNETFGFIIAYFSLVVALAIYRHLKSMVPGWGNSP